MHEEPLVPFRRSLSTEGVILGLWVNVLSAFIVHVRPLR